MTKAGKRSSQSARGKSSERGGDAQQPRELWRRRRRGMRKKKIKKQRYRQKGDLYKGAAVPERRRNPRAVKVSTPAAVAPDELSRIPTARWAVGRPMCGKPTGGVGHRGQAHSHTPNSIEPSRIARRRHMLSLQAANDHSFCTLPPPSGSTYPSCGYWHGATAYARSSPPCYWSGPCWCLCEEYALVHSSAARVTNAPVAACRCCTYSGCFGQRLRSLFVTAA
ncbi:uncharacterized protein K452DRAFT_79475 [Aplosporella prunicola CBS 121167]|uniref:Uncharacterized protein n=1 Tax=Aplosporella prunicola CBS 121167 TaxID=1176127 RepID=A0A6A6B898_9PEZI|nr:uncharacterized protein K452DRAFT_79475 [Aplosporella prunicola CBS 121167]KAF2139011.1 hypothetical protein K452DRAFT_79475 [Aplosporella prunicola CBS 121167]